MRATTNCLSSDWKWEISHLIFSLRNHFIAETLIFNEVWSKVFGMRNSNPVSEGRIYALDFLTKKALLSRDIDSQQNVIVGLLYDGGFRETNRRLESLISHVFAQIFSKINISAEKWFLSEKIKCIISSMRHWIRIPHLRKPLIKLRRKSISRLKSALLRRKWGVMFTILSPRMDFLSQLAKKDRGGEREAFISVLHGGIILTE